MSFSGPNFGPPTIRAALDAVDLQWERSESQPDDENDCHRALVGATTEQEAIHIVREALTSYGTFGDFDAAPVRDARGDVRCTPLRTHWRDVDWNEVERKATLSELERVVISTFLNAAEPTWIILQDPDVPDDLTRVEAVLRDLERRGLVHTTWEPAGGPEDFGVLETWHGRPERMCDWWALTDEGWDLLGLIKSPGYH